MSKDPFGLGFSEEEERPLKSSTAVPPDGEERPLKSSTAVPPDEGDSAAETPMEATWAVPDPEPPKDAPPEPTPSQTEPEGETASLDQFLERLADGRHLTRAEAATALERIVEGDVSDAQTAAFLMGLRVKGETADEVAGFLEVMRKMAVAVDSPHRESMVDIVGTGGDRLGTFNISTAAALVVAGAGVKVAKHGNRAASSQCGSADVLEALGVRTDLTPEGVATCIEEVGMGFMLASRHHPAMAKVAGARRALGVRTVFNVLGPLTNPASVQRYLLGVSSHQQLEILGGALARVGCRHALVVHSDEGMDELSVTSSNTIVEVERGVVQPPYTLTPEECGVQRWALRGVQGGDAAANAFIIKGILGGSKGAPRDAVITNAGAALYVAGRVSSIKDGIEVAAGAVDDGRAGRVLEDLVNLTGRLAEGSS